MFFIRCIPKTPSSLNKLECIFLSCASNLKIHTSTTLTVASIFIPQTPNWIRMLQRFSPLWWFAYFLNRGNIISLQPSIYYSINFVFFPKNVNGEKCNFVPLSPANKHLLRLHTFT